MEMENEVGTAPPVVVDAGILLDPSRALDAAKDLGRALQRNINLITKVGKYEIVYFISIKVLECKVYNVTIIDKTPIPDHSGRI